MNDCVDGLVPGMLWDSSRDPLCHFYGAATLLGFFIGTTTRIPFVTSYNEKHVTANDKRAFLHLGQWDILKAVIQRARLIESPSYPCVERTLAAAPPHDLGQTTICVCFTVLLFGTCQLSQQSFFNCCSFIGLLPACCLKHSTDIRFTRFRDAPLADLLGYVLAKGSPDTQHSDCLASCKLPMTALLLRNSY